MAENAKFVAIMDRNVSIVAKLVRNIRVLRCVKR